MITPDKNIKISNSLLGTGALLLESLKTPQTVSSLWEKVRDKYQEINTFEKYVLTLDFLFCIGIIVLSEGIIKRKIISI